MRHDTVQLPSLFAVPRPLHVTAFEYWQAGPAFPATGPTLSKR